MLIEMNRKVLTSSNLAYTISLAQGNYGTAEIHVGHSLYFMGCVRFAWYCSSKMYSSLFFLWTIARGSCCSWTLKSGTLYYWFKENGGKRKRSCRETNKTKSRVAVTTNQSISGPNSCTYPSTRSLYPVQGKVIKSLWNALSDSVILVAWSSAQCVTPENIHTLPQVASWNSEEEGGFLDWNSDGMGGLHSLEFQMHWEGYLCLESLICQLF